MAVLAEAKQTSDECFVNEQRFTDNTDWRIAGAVCAAHCILPFVASFILWEGMHRGLEWSRRCLWRSLFKMPIAFIAKWRKFTLEKKLFENYARADRNQNAETVREYRRDKAKWLNELLYHDNYVILSLVVEASTEASFQVRILKIIVTFTYPFH